MRRLLLAIILLLPLAGCAAADVGGGGGGRADAAPAARPAGQRYEADATVLENSEHGPELCFGVRDSLPPQCGGAPITNWDWDKVEGEARRSGVTWGSYHVIGTYDGTSFTVAEAGPPRLAPTEAQAPFPPACPEPKGGWTLPDPARATEERLQAALAAARSQPDFAGAWVAYLAPFDPDATEDSREFVVNVAFTGDLDRHEADLRAAWGGRLCVARKARSFAELARVQRELHQPGAAGEDLDLQIVTSGIDEVGNAVTVTVVHGADRAQAALDRRYGAGAVRVDSALKPVA
jgi:hypothetical protein